MDKNILRKILLDQKDQIGIQGAGVEREALLQLSQYTNIPHAIIIAGMRRVGKSFLLHQFLNKNNVDYYYCNFEDERFINFTVQDFNPLYEAMLEQFGEKKVFLLDEIQNIKGWEKFVRRMMDQGNKFYITGSNASMFSKELGSSLTGRHITINLYPFSFREYLTFLQEDYKQDELDSTKTNARIKSLFTAYLHTGGMPEYLEYNKKSEILRDVYDDILYKDIITRYKIEAVQTFRELSLYLISNVASLYTNNSLKGFLTLGSLNTLKDYIGYLENSFLFFSVKQFNKSLKVQSLTPKKIYTIDNGMLNVIAFKNSIDNGKLLENLVYIEILRRGNNAYYYKTEKGLEIDFIERSSNKIGSLIQVCWHIEEKSTREREIAALIEGMVELHLKKGIILTQDHEEDIEHEGKHISIIPVHKWLLR